ncbi:MAG: spore maturation protein A [Ruminococcus sp.]|nr:spore maturation protein A [Ruminococcus sp.]
MLGFLLMLMIAASIIFSLSNGSASELSSSVFESSKGAISLCVSLASSMALWGGIMNIAEKCGITKAVTKVIKKPLKLLFKTLKDDKALELIALNVTANLLGLGNAATPLGLKAMKELKVCENCQGRNTAIFILLNTASIQLIPITVSVMRTEHGASNPWDCTIPTIITSFCALLIGCITTYALYSKISEEKFK